MDVVKLKYGNGNLTLRKSDKLIGVRPTSGPGRKRLDAARANLSLPPGDSQTLGGFHIINAADAPKPAEDTLDALRDSPDVATGTHVYHSSDDDVPIVPTGQIFLRFAPGAQAEGRERLLEESGLQIVEARADDELIVQTTPASPNPLKVAAALQQSPLVAVAEPDLATRGQLQGFVLPSDPRIVEQWHLRNTGRHRGTTTGFKAGADARVMDAWETSGSLGSPNVVIAVIDDGFDLGHPDLSDEWKIVAPKDFTKNTSSPLPDPIYADIHGTACAGVALGNADGTGICGAAPRCRMMPIRWGVDLSDRQLEDWFGYVRAQGAWVVSCSWSAVAWNFPLSTRAGQAIARCAAEGRDGLGTVICFAAGNENRDIDSPATGSLNGFATHPDVIAVAACNSRDVRSGYSNFGRAIWVCAPSSGAGGWGITTSDVMGQYTRGGQTFEAGYSPGGYTDDFGGTSSACPLVAGICGLIFSVRPDLTAGEVKQLLAVTARKIGDQTTYTNGHSPYFGYGCVDADAAIKAAISAGPEGSDGKSNGHAGNGASAARRARAGGMTVRGPIEPAWGAKGHRSINRIATQAVPVPLRQFYEAHLDMIEAHAMDADEAKAHDPEEGRRHFIDIDRYGKPPFDGLPEDFAKAVAKFGENVVLANGILPWQIGRTFDELVSAFRSHNWDSVVRHSAWLGHYVGDAHVPFHTTENHNGQLTGQKGLHSYFEAKLLDRYVKASDIQPAPAQTLSATPTALAFLWVRESHARLAALLEADATNGGKTGRRDLAGFAKVGQPIAVERLSTACTNLASLWYSAWTQAGKPVFDGLAGRAESPDVPLNPPNPVHHNRTLETETSMGRR